MSDFKYHKAAHDLDSELEEIMESHAETSVDAAAGQEGQKQAHAQTEAPFLSRFANIGAPSIEAALNGANHKVAMAVRMFEDEVREKLSSHKTNKEAALDDFISGLGQKA